MWVVSNITWWLFNTTLRIWFSIIALPTILIIVVNLTNKILTVDLVNSLSIVLWYVDNIIWTKTTNYILIALSIILITRIIRFFNRFITWNLGEDEK